MFDYVRKHTRVMQFILFLLIFPSFVLVGINGYDRFSGQGEVVAKVDGHDIRQAEWDAAHKQQVDRVRQQMPNLDAKLLESPVSRYVTLEQLVRDRVLTSAAEKMHLQISDQRFKRVLASDKSLDPFYGPDGRLDVQRFISATGMTPDQYRARLMGDLSSRQVLGGIGGTAFTAAAQVTTTLAPYFERREVQVLQFPASDYASKVSPTDADLDAYYKANPAEFQSPEQASVEYVVLDLDTVMKTITVNEQELKTYYEQNQGRLSGKEERRASHILVAAAKTAPAAERDKAKAKAAELLAAVKKAPDSFAEVAKKNSQDPGSAANGGDLDFFARGAMTKAFEDAVFAMNKGDIVGPVETEFGWHIIKLTDVKTPKVRAYEEVKPELEADLKKQQAQRKYSEAAAEFTDIVYQQPDSLKPAADKLKLEIRKAPAVGRTPAAGVNGPLGNAKFLAALFAPDSLSKKNNTEAVELAPNTLASGRIVQYSPARTIALAEVKDKVRARVIAVRAAELARKDGMDKLAAWKANPASATLPGAVSVSRQDAQKQPQKVVDAAMRMDPSALPALSGVDMGEAGYAIVRLNKVLQREAPTAEAAAQERAQLNQAWAAAENDAYYQLLKEKLKVQMKAPKPAATEIQ